jgi:hypothetical protein
MAGPPPVRRTSRRGRAARVLEYPERAILSVLMYVAAMLVERRLRKAVRSGAAAANRSGRG